MLFIMLILSCERYRHVRDSNRQKSVREKKKKNCSMIRFVVIDCWILCIHSCGITTKEGWLSVLLFLVDVIVPAHTLLIFLQMLLSQCLDVRLSTLVTSSLLFSSFFFPFLGGGCSSLFSFFIFLKLLWMIIFVFQFK